MGIVNINLENPSHFQIFTETIDLRGTTKVDKNRVKKVCRTKQKCVSNKK